MGAVATLLLVALALALAAGLLLERRRHDAELSAREGAWREERAELLNRVQRPEWIPARRAQPRESRPTDLTAYSQIGSLTATAQENGDGDDA